MLEYVNAGNRTNTKTIASPQNSRRGFLRGVGLGAASAAALGGGTLIASSAKANAALDLEILNFALNLEYLEASFYLLAATGKGIPTQYLGSNPGTVKGGSQVPFKTALVTAYANEIAQEELKHVIFLRAAITAAKSTPVSCPNIDFTDAFVTLGKASNVSATFNPFADENQFLLGSYVFEDVGVTAYHGAATSISTPAYLDAAAGIMAVEAYHAGLIRTVLFAGGYSSQTQAISRVRATLDNTYGSKDIDDYGVGNDKFPSIVTCSNANNGSSDNNAIAFDRTTRQVLNIVYGAKSATKGLFFPSGMNGAIK